MLERKKIPPLVTLSREAAFVMDWGKVAIAGRERKRARGAFKAQKSGREAGIGPARPLSLYAKARRALRVGLPFPPISRHAESVEGPSWFQVEAPASVFSADCMKRSSFSESLAQGRADTFSLYMVMNCCFVMVLDRGFSPCCPLH